MTERICERCHKIFAIDGDVCPDDGARLMSIASPIALVGRVIEDKLTITGVLGQGGMGVVYRARQHSMDREVAVKVLHPSFASDREAVRRFLHEARAATRLDHPNIITVFDFGQTDDGLLYIVMELLVGHSLGNEVDASAIAPARAVHILSQVADAVEHAHGRGLVHRDLKPENVFLLHGSSLRGDHVKVLDFGIATMRAQEGVDKITRTGAVCGTPAYMSPEQVLGDQVDSRSDVYSLAVVAFEMLTAQHPFRAETPMRQMLAHLDHPVPSFAEMGADSSIPPALEAAVRRGLEKKRDQRTQSALQFAHEIVAALGAAPTPAILAAVTPSQSSPTSPAAISSPSSSSPSSSSPSSSIDRRDQDATGRATPAPKPRPKWQAYAPYAGVLAVIIAAVAFLALRAPEEPERPAVEPAVVAAKTEPVTKAPEPVAKAPEPVAKAPTPAPAPAPAPTPAPAVEVAKPEPVKPEPPKPEPIAEPAPFVIDTTPRGVDVVIEGKVVGQTPLNFARPVGEAIVKIVLRKRGYKEQRLELAASSPPPAVVKLKPVPKTETPTGFQRID